MTEEEFYAKVKEKYGSRGLRQAKEMVNGMVFCDGIEKPLDKKSPAAQALMQVFLKHKEENKKYTPKKYRK